MGFLTIALRNVMRRPLRSCLTLFAVALAVGAVVSLVGIANGFKATFLDFYQGVGIDLLVVRSGSARRLTSTLDERLGDKIAALPGVAEVIPGLADVVSFPDEGLYVVAVSGLVPETRVFESMDVVEGRMLRVEDGRGLMLGATLADSLQKSVGDSVEVVEDEAYEVVGIFDGFNVLQNGSIVISIQELQRLMGREGQVSGFSIVTEDASDDQLLDRIAAQVQTMESGISVRRTREHVESISEIQIAIAMAWLTSTVAILIGSIGMLNTMFMSVQERTVEIGLLRAVGWSRLRVISMILNEAALLSVLGAIVGTLGAMLLVRCLTVMPVVNGLIEGRISAAIVVQGLLIALVVGFLGGLLPAVRASRLSPSVALRR
jgi:putative ABC transport system permease protein